MYLAPIRSPHKGKYLALIRASFLFERCSNFNEVMGDAERAVRKIESSFRMRNVGFSLFLTCILARFMRTVILLDRWKISDYLQSKRVSQTVKMVDSCSRENGVLCTVTRSWLLFLHEESEWKNFESNIAWGVDELHQTFLFEQFFNGKLCCKIHDLLIVPIIFFWIGLLGAISRWMSD